MRSVSILCGFASLSAAATSPAPSREVAYWVDQLLDAPKIHEEMYTAFSAAHEAPVEARYARLISEEERKALAQRFRKDIRENGSSEGVAAQALGAFIAYFTPQNEFCDIVFSFVYTSILQTYFTFLSTQPEERRHQVVSILFEDTIASFQTLKQSLNPLSISATAWEKLALLLPPKEQETLRLLSTPEGREMRLAALKIAPLLEPLQADPAIDVDTKRTVIQTFLIHTTKYFSALEGNECQALQQWVAAIETMLATLEETLSEEAWGAAKPHLEVIAGNTTAAPAHEE